MPYAITSRSHASLQTAKIITDASSTNALQIKVYSSSSTHSLYAGYDNNYSVAIPAGTTSHTGIFETEFSLSASETALFEIAGTMVIRKNEADDKWGLYARTSRLAGNNGYNTMAKLVDISPTMPTDLSTKYSLAYKLTTAISGTTMTRTLESVPLGNEVVWTGNLALSTSFSSSYFKPETGADVQPMFAVVLPSASGATNIYMNVYSVKYSDYVAPVATPLAITEVSHASGTTISPVSSLTYTFNEKVSEGLLTAANVVLEEEDKTASSEAWVTRDSEPYMSLDATGKILAVNFPAGALSANTKYRLTFTTNLASEAGGVLAEATSYTYTTTSNGAYYVNDNFSSYPVMGATGVGSVGKTMLPYERFYSSQDVYQTLAVVQDGNAKALQLKAFKRHTNILGYRNKYAESYSGTSHKGVLEVEFALQGSNATFVDIAGIIVIRKDATGEGYGIYARTAGTVSSVQYAADESYDNMVRLADFTVPTATMSERYTLKCIVTTMNPNSNYYDARQLHAVYVNNTPIPLPENATSLSIAKAGPHNTQGVLFNPDGNGTTNTRLFTIANTDTSTSYLNVYSLKYYDYIKVSVEDGASNGEKRISIINHAGETLNGRVVLAVYNGETLVGADGLSKEAISVSNGGSVSVTRTVSSVVTGNTYKVMLLNSKENLQPLTQAFEGEIQ